MLKSFFCKTSCGSAIKASFIALALALSFNKISCGSAIKASFIALALALSFNKISCGLAIKASFIALALALSLAKSLSLAKLRIKIDFCPQMLCFIIKLSYFCTLYRGALYLIIGIAAQCETIQDKHGRKQMSRRVQAMPCLATRRRDTVTALFLLLKPHPRRLWRLAPPRRRGERYAELFRLSRNKYVLKEKQVCFETEKSSTGGRTPL